MKELKISFEQARDLAEMAVADRGADYVYPNSMSETRSCLYFEDIGPSCLVGWFFHRMGMTKEDFLVTPPESTALLNIVGVEFLADNGYLKADTQTLLRFRSTVTSAEALRDFIQRGWMPRLLT